MAVIVLASASGAPGVTSAALGLALVWHRPLVLVDADPVGGSALLAGYFKGTLTDDDAMVSLVMAHRDGRLGQDLHRTLLQVPDTTVSILPGPKSHAQAASLDELWPSLAYELRGLERTGQDVIVDAGRLGMVHSPLPLIAAADLALLVTRTDLPSLAAARQWGERWAASTADGTGAAAAGALLIGPGRPYVASEVAKVLAVPVVESIAWDPRAARMFSEGENPPPVTWKNRDQLVRSLRSAAAAIAARVTAERLNLAPDTGPRSSVQAGASQGAASTGAAAPPPGSVQGWKAAR